MPIYEHVCRECGNRYDALRRMQDADRDLKCPQCESEQVERLLSTFSAGGCSSSGSGRFT